MASERTRPGPPRGVLPSEAGHSRLPSREQQHERLSPSPKLAPFIAHFWWVRWDLEEPRVVETLPHPTVHLVFESPDFRGVASGLSLRRFTKKLEGSGRVFGIKLRPAVFGALAAGKLARFRDRPMPVGEALASRELAFALEELGRELPEIESGAAAVARAEALLEGVEFPTLAPALVLVRDLVERLEHEREFRRVRDLALALKLDVRSVERRFEEFVGLPPKEVLARYRLIEAAERLCSEPRVNLATLAAELGYTDQAHFTRSFRQFVGRTPRQIRSSSER